ncbi:hypothetical protein V8E36_003711 [Tilletia maclaganii]
MFALRSTLSGPSRLDRLLGSSAVLQNEDQDPNPVRPRPVRSKGCPESLKGLERNEWLPEKRRRTKARPSTPHNITLRQAASRAADHSDWTSGSARDEDSDSGGELSDISDWSSGSNLTSISDVDESDA